MGYSATSSAFNTLELIKGHYNQKITNTLDNGYFWEIGKEQHDGAISGLVFKPYHLDPNKCIKAGTFKIAANGDIVRFTGIPSKLWPIFSSKGVS